MSSDNKPEHFVTLFDSNYLPMGMALHDSLMAHGQPFHLWVVCMDELAEKQLDKIALSHVTLLPLREVETGELLEVKPGRSRGEYCWTMTPFTFQAVFDRDAGVERVTYLDSDLFFFASPRVLLRELDEAGKHVLITEHAYAPEYDEWMALSGRFCVQFLTFRRTAEAKKVMDWWRQKCLEWCFARNEEGKFGDQKYLDVWPELFADEVHIVRQTEKTLAPWNVYHRERTSGARLAPVFFHFHGLKLVGLRRARLCDNYRIGTQGLRLYGSYAEALGRCIDALQALGMPVPYRRERFSPMGMIRSALNRTPRFMKIPAVLPARRGGN
jgi:hypothetical protein